MTLVTVPTLIARSIDLKAMVVSPESPNSGIGFSMISDGYLHLLESIFEDDINLTSSID